MLRSLTLIAACVSSLTVFPAVAPAAPLAFFDMSPQYRVTPARPGFPDQHPDGVDNTDGEVSFLILVATANGGWTITRDGDIEVALRAKLRYDPSGQITNLTRFDGNNNYFFDPADGVAPAGLAIWNFEWSIFTSRNLLGEYIWDLTVTTPLGVAASINPASTNIFTERGYATSIGNFNDGFTTAANRNYAQGTRNVGSMLNTFSENVSRTGDWPLAEAAANGLFRVELTGTYQGSGGLGDLFVSMNVLVEPIAPAPIPLPAPIILLATGMLALCGASRGRRQGGAPA